jgi:(2S)-methylsuccinyl-CoA dehydrogenase
MSELSHAKRIVTGLQKFVDQSASHFSAEFSEDGALSTDRMDRNQTLLYDLASIASATTAARHLTIYGESGPMEACIALAYAGEVAIDARSRLGGRLPLFGHTHDHLDDQAINAARNPSLFYRIADNSYLTTAAGPRYLDEEFALIRDTFRRFSKERVAPHADRIHRNDEDVPEEIIRELSAIGCFGLSIPTEYGGSNNGDSSEFLRMLLATEELSRGSLAAAGSLITRPEIVVSALLQGGTDSQKERWLPYIADGRRMCAVAVTEPDYGSDVAQLSTTATRRGDEWIVNGTKTWCTFAGRAEYLLLLARTNSNRSLRHRGLSLFIVEKPAYSGHSFSSTQDGGGEITAHAIPTIGYRGMHSFEITFRDWSLPHSDLIGMDDGVGRGFYLQMHAFTAGRLQTAGRALGVMESSFEEALRYTQERLVFGRHLSEFELTRMKIARMAISIVACREFATAVAKRLSSNDGQLEASKVKQLACRTAEWVTRESQQLYGGYGYAEESTISRNFVDARVLSIFEGTDEVLALKVISRGLIEKSFQNNSPS